MTDDPKRDHNAGKHKYMLGARGTRVVVEKLEQVFVLDDTFVDPDTGKEVKVGHYIDGWTDTKLAEFANETTGCTSNGGNVSNIRQSEFGRLTRGGARQRQNEPESSSDLMLKIERLEKDLGWATREITSIMSVVESLEAKNDFFERRIASAERDGQRADNIITERLQKLEEFRDRATASLGPRLRNGA